jgi:putative hydrolase of the HAD superfamily
MGQSVRCLLIDADGVIQKASPARRDAFSRILGGRDNEVSDFVGSYFRLEDAAQIGEIDIAEALPSFLASWRAAGSAADMIGALRMIDNYPGALGEVQNLRTSGMYCCLATNQERHRGIFMSQSLGYRELFDREFYSYALGVAKPDVAFYRAVVEALPYEPSEMLMADDRAENAAAAEQMGIAGFLFPRGNPTGRNRAWETIRDICGISRG